MQVQEYILNDLKPLALSAQVGDTLRLMEELKYSHLPVLDQAQYLGIISEDDLLNIDRAEDQLSQHQRVLKPYSIVHNEHLYRAIAVLGEGHLSLLPVLDEDAKYIGYLSAQELTWDLGRQVSYAEMGSLLVLRVATRDYHLSQIAQIVESEDARITGLQLRSEGADFLRIALKINQVDLGRIVKSLERYEYEIVELYHKSLFDETASDRYGALMKYLNI